MVVCAEVCLVGKDCIEPIAAALLTFSDLAQELSLAMTPSFGTTCES